MKKSLRFLSIYSFGVVSLVFLFGCFPGGEKKEKDLDDVVLLEINNKPALTKSELFKAISSNMAHMGKIDPSILPLEFQKKALDDLTNFKLVVEAARQEGLDKDSEYVKIYESNVDQLKQTLLHYIYQRKILDKVEVSEDEISKEYEQNKSRYVETQGGVLVSGVSFKDRDKALGFYDRIKGRMSDFESVGKKEKEGKFKEFGRVSQDSQGPGMGAVSTVIRDAALKLVKIPGVDLVKDGKQVWVIYVSDKKESGYYELIKIHDEIKKIVQMNKFAKIWKQKPEELKKKFTIKINEDYFKKSEPSKDEGDIEQTMGAEQKEKEEESSEQKPAKGDDTSQRL